MGLSENPALWCCLLMGVVSQAKTLLSKDVYGCAGTSRLTLKCAPGSTIHIVSTLYGAHHSQDHETACEYIHGDCFHHVEIPQQVKDCNGKTSCIVTIKAIYLSCYFDHHVISQYVGLHYECVSAPTRETAVGTTNLQQTTKGNGLPQELIKGPSTKSTTTPSQQWTTTNPSHTMANTGPAKPIIVLPAKDNSGRLLLIMALTVAGLVLIVIIYTIICVISKRCKKKKDEESIQLITSETQTDTLHPAESPPPLYRKQGVDDNIYSDVDSLPTGPPPPKPPRSPRYGAVQSSDLGTERTVGDTITETDGDDGDNEETEDLYASIDTLQKMESSKDNVVIEGAAGESQTTQDAGLPPTESRDTVENDIPHTEVDGDLYALPVKVKNNTK